MREKLVWLLELERYEGTYAVDMKEYSNSITHDKSLASKKQIKESSHIIARSMKNINQALHLNLQFVGSLLLSKNNSYHQQ